MIARELHKHWHPPHGLSEELSAMLEIELNRDGSIHEVVTKQGSGVLMYDIHARNAVYAMQFPKACWTTTITITFNQ